MKEPGTHEPPDVDRLIADVVRASSKVHWCRSRWESDEQACREEAAAIAALRAAFQQATPRPPAPPAIPSALASGDDVAAPAPPAQAPIDLRFDGSQLLEAVGRGRFHLEQMSANHWWAVLEAEGRRVDVWLHAKGSIQATFESVETGPPPAPAAGHFDAR
jgi:hypothetical protein